MTIIFLTLFIKNTYIVIHDEYDLAIQNYKEALRLKPDYPAATRNSQTVLDEQSKDK